MQWGDMEDLLSSDAKDPEDHDDEAFDETYYEFCICKQGKRQLFCSLMYCLLIMKYSTGTPTCIIL